MSNRLTVIVFQEKAPEPLYGLGLNDVSDREWRSSDPGFMFKPVEAKYSILLAEGLASLFVRSGSSC